MSEMKMTRVLTFLSCCLFSQVLVTLAFTTSLRPMTFHFSKSQFNAKSTLSESYFSEFVSYFQGDFDNYCQVISDRQSGLQPREGGGHEHLHVTLIPVPLDILPKQFLCTEIGAENETGAVLAAYYFDGMPNRIFRLRFYLFQNEKRDKNLIKMKLFSLNPSIEGKMRQESTASMQRWLCILMEYLSSPPIAAEAFTELERCDVWWASSPDPIRHSYLKDVQAKGDEETVFHAVTIHDYEKGGILLESQMAPGSYLRVVDELSLWKDELWINDRGYNPDSGDMVYGNFRGVPYEMKRVTRLSPSTKYKSHVIEWGRDIVNETLSWTLGEEYRTPEEFDNKIQEIGGMSSNLNRAKVQNGKG